MSGNDVSFEKELQKSNDTFEKIMKKIATVDIYLKEIEKQDKMEKDNYKKTFLYFHELLYFKNLKFLEAINTKNKVYIIKQISNFLTDNNIFNLINSKNFLCKILFNFAEIIKELFASSNISNTENILESLKNIFRINNCLLKAYLEH